MSFKQNNPLSRKTSPINKNWIKGAIKRPGAFRKKAEEAGMSTKAFADKVIANKEDYDSRTDKQAELAKTLMGMSRHESGHINPEQGDFDYEDPNYKETKEYKKFQRQQKRQKRKNKKDRSQDVDDKGRKRGEAGFQQDEQEAYYEGSPALFKDPADIPGGMGDEAKTEELPEVVVTAPKNRSREAIKARKATMKSEGKSKREIRLEKTKDKVQAAKKATVDAKDKDSQKLARAKANRLAKRVARQEGRAERRKVRKSKKFRENKEKEIIASRRKQQEKGAKGASALARKKCKYKK